MGIIEIRAAELAAMWVPEEFAMPASELARRRREEEEELMRTSPGVQRYSDEEEDALAHARTLADMRNHLRDRGRWPLHQEQKPEPPPRHVYHQLEVGDRAREQMTRRVNRAYDEAQLLGDLSPNRMSLGWAIGVAVLSVIIIIWSNGGFAMPDRAQVKEAVTVGAAKLDEAQGKAVEMAQQASILPTATPNPYPNYAQDWPMLPAGIDDATFDPINGSLHKLTRQPYRFTGLFAGRDHALCQIETFDAGLKRMTVFIPCWRINREYSPSS